ncbi:MAG: phosphate transport system regulatory protein PhoU [Planctomycetota bacterium]|nr:MAG: phosphate transport system regulatory protein PhoU [Planctomycetota bacterium]
MSKHLARDLERLNRDLLTLGAMVEEATNKAITAFVDRRAELAEQVRAGDEAIDDFEIQVEVECLKILALHQPVAQDLRYIVAVLKVNNDLERIGDHALAIAERAASLLAHPPIELVADIAGMAEKVRQMVRSSLDALVNRDTALARQVLEMDDEIDRVHQQMFGAVQDAIRRDLSVIEPAIQHLSVSRHLERIADLATNIAEDVVFLVEGEVIRHGHASQPPTAAEASSGSGP